MTTAKLLQNGGSQAVRLPEEFRFTGKEVTVQRYGNGVLLLPKEKNFDSLFEACGQFSDDFFVNGREQRLPQERPPLRR